MINTALKFLVIVSVCFVAGCSKEINEEEFLLKSAEGIVGVVAKEANVQNNLKPTHDISPFHVGVSYNTEKTDSLSTPYLTEIIITYKAKHPSDWDKSWEEGPRILEESKATFSLGWETPVGSDTPRWVFKVAEGDIMQWRLHGGPRRSTWLVDRLVGVESVDEVIRYSNPDFHDYISSVPESYIHYAWMIADALKEQPIMGEDEIE